MELEFTLCYEDKVIKKDISKMSKTDQHRIKEALENKLKINPCLYGTPLHYNLRALRKFKVGKYRVIFFIKDQDINIIYIGFRDKAYKNKKLYK